MIVVLYKSCFTNSVKGIGIFNFAISVCILNEGCDLLIWINSSLVIVVWVGLSCFYTVIFSFSVWVSCVLLLLALFSGVFWEVVNVFSDFELSEVVFVVAAFRSIDFGSAVDVLDSKFVVLAELVVLTAVDFYESFFVWSTSSIMSTIFGLGEILEMENFWEELEFCLFSLGRICRNFVVGASTIFLFSVWGDLLV